MSWKLPLPPFGAQKTAVDKALNQRGWAHFLEQGLGKTAVIYNEWLLYRDQGEVNALVVIAPNSLLGNWKAEAEKFGIQDEVVVWNSGRGKSIASEVDRLLRTNAPLIFVINYEAVPSNGGKVVEAILAKRRVMMVADESISLKNPNGQRSKEIRELAKSARLVRALSGAPVSQGVHDLWAQMRFVGHLEGTNFFAFRNRYCVLGGFKGKQVIRPRSDTADELTYLLSKCSFRAEKKDWTDIPEKLYTTRNVDMPKAQADAYESMAEDFMTMLKDDVDVTADLVITKLMKLQQISTGFIMDDANQTHWLVSDEENPKLRMLKEVMEETDNKVIVFTFHRAAVDLLRRSLPADETAFLVGEMTREQIEAEKARFNLAHGVKTMVCQINAAMYGHTLLGTADRPCHTTVFFENNYSLNARVQAEDRNHRHGQKNNVLYVDLITSKMDNTVIGALKLKQNVAVAVMESLKKGKQK